MGRFNLSKHKFLLRRRKARSVDLPATYDDDSEFERIRERAVRRWKSFTPGCTGVLISGRSPSEEFHRLFPSLPTEEFPLNVYTCALNKDILLQGKMFVSQNWICFYSNIFGYETKVKIEMDRIIAIKREKTAFVVPNAISVQTPNKRFFFCSFLARETVFRLISRTWRQAITNENSMDGKRMASDNGQEIQGVDCNQNDSTISIFDTSMDGPRAVCSDIDEVQVLKAAREDDIMFPSTVHVNKLQSLNGYRRVSITVKPETQLSRWNTMSDLRDVKTSKRRSRQLVLKEEKFHSVSERSPQRTNRPLLTASVVRWFQALKDAYTNSFNSLPFRSFDVSTLFRLICIAIVVLSVMSVFLLYKINSLSQLFGEREDSISSFCSAADGKYLNDHQEHMYSDKLRRVNNALASNLHAVHEAHDTLRKIKEDLGR